MITINLFGLDLEISWSSIILVFLVTDATKSYLNKSDPLLLQSKRLAVLVTVLLIFFSLFLHELLHGMLAILFNYEVNKAMVWALGAGVYIQTPIDEMKFGEALLILLAGPVCNLLLAFYFRHKSNHFDGRHYQYRFLALVNMSLFYINILPAFPLDGGKVLYTTFLQFLEEPIALAVSLIFTVVLVILMIIFGSGHKQILNKFLPDNNF